MSWWNFAFLNPAFGIMKAKWVLCIKFPPSELFTSSLLTPITLGAQLPSRSQCASNHSQTALAEGGGGTGLPRHTDINVTETKRSSYSRDGRWFIDRSSSTYMRGNLSTPWKQNQSPLLQVTAASKDSGKIKLCTCCQSARHTFTRIHKNQSKAVWKVTSTSSTEWGSLRHFCFEHSGETRN